MSLAVAEGHIIFIELIYMKEYYLFCNHFNHFRTTKLNVKVVSLYVITTDNLVIQSSK